MCHSSRSSCILYEILCSIIIHCNVYLCFEHYCYNIILCIHVALHLQNICASGTGGVCVNLLASRGGGGSSYRLWCSMSSVVIEWCLCQGSVDRVASYTLASIAESLFSHAALKPER